MTEDLRARIERLASEFARDLFRAFRDVSFLEFVTELRGAADRPLAPRGAAPAAPRAKGGRRRGRRSTTDLGAIVERIVTTLKAAGPAGLRAEHLRRELGLPRAKILRPVEIALATKRIHKRGSRRATTYFAR